MLNRYSDIDFVMSMEIDDGIELIYKANEKLLEEKLFLRWLPYQENISFDNFKNILSSSTKRESKEQILDKVKNILEMKVGE